ncbi:hypothetical protein E1A91_A13G165400v1 [Gossypium mustelinum]|uniref:Uncharacterized protein LOC107895293 n=6 Tax=Gossypium TaxID=3633 RepID=A0A1U8II75_GOSHI|nr:uncharacterized protein LOC107895293 [Gossypium hirsutum]XP_016676083.1 uncharacterized protein LOC107895293 [Gossypium hirsutum]XP_016676084.1 uncharacterized protein LOC107895293 [Gossypium hirsutum]XP_016676085.1 uncharacterized protein LOC107895293 [Gossypium hirsutum]XP_016676086.1 uncharacterized protein LOC107895293 [Gossypium hirsutum]XP_040941275.1 uncharacterized protein LOC107895293 [Gossypium hirsutum]TYG86904.1 hypothetical protein ES288_A13G170200v1 [Gossypium darwinii]TYH92
MRTLFHGITLPTSPTLPPFLRVRTSFLFIMESFEQVKGNGGVIDQTMEDAGATNPRVLWKQMGYEEKTVAVHEEMKRMNRLPATSSYVTHRMRVLNKILQLLSIQRTASQEEELELLFAGLSL